MVISVRGFGLCISAVLLMCGHLAEELDWKEVC